MKNSQTSRFFGASSFKPRIFRQIFLLVFIPLLVITSLLLTLRAIDKNSEQAMREELRHASLLRSLSVWISKWAQDQGRVLILGTNEKRLEKDWEDEQTRYFEEWFEHQAQLSGKTSLNHKRFARLTELLRQKTNFFKTRSARSKDSISAMDLSSLSQIRSLCIEFRQFLSLESLEQQRLSESRSRSQHSELLFLYSVYLLDLLLTLALTFAAYKSMTKRLLPLTRNASRVINEEAQLETIRGDDEIAFLGKVFEQVQKRLANLSELRRTILGMVSHDMRTPLMAVQVNLQLIEETGVEFSDDAFYAVDKTYKSIDEILLYLSDILEIQRRNQIEVPATENDGETEHIQSETQASIKTQNYPEPNRIRNHRVLKQNPSLFSKVLLLVLLPMILQTVLFGFMLIHLHETEATVLHSRRQTDLIVGMQVSWLDLVIGASSEAVFACTKKPKYHLAANNAFNRIQERYLELKNLAKGDKRWSELIMNSERNFLDQLQEIRKIGADSSLEETVSILMDLSEIYSAKPLSRNLRKESGELSASEALKMDLQEEQLVSTGQRVSAYLLMGVLANLFLALVFLHWLNLEINNRLCKLIQNAMSLVQKDVLAPQSLSGTDEFAFLDRVLSDSRQRLSDATNERLKISNALVGKMKLPLLDARQDLSTVIKLEKNSLDDTSAILLERSIKSVEQAQELVSDLETLESLVEGKLQLVLTKCDCFDLAAQAIESVTALAEKYKVVLINSCAHLQVNGDKRRLVQVLINYLSNAIKFSPAETSVTITAERKSEQKVRISVSDQGPGIDENSRAHVFEKFFQVAEEKKGLGFGLGLAICKLIVETHQGKLGVDSVEGSGSIFWFELDDNDNTRDNPVFIDQNRKLSTTEESTTKLALYTKEDKLLLAFSLPIYASVVIVTLSASNAISANKAKKTNTVKVGGDVAAVKHRVQTEIPETLRRIAQRSRTVASPAERELLVRDLNSFVNGQSDPRILTFSYFTLANIEESCARHSEALKSLQNALPYTLQNGGQTQLTGRCYAFMSKVFLSIANEHRNTQSLNSDDLANVLESAGVAVQILEDKATPIGILETWPTDLQPVFVDADEAIRLAYTCLGESYSLSADTNPQSRKLAIKYLRKSLEYTNTGSVDEAQCKRSILLARMLLLDAKKQEALELMKELEAKIQTARKETFHLSDGCYHIGNFYAEEKYRAEAELAYKKGLSSAQASGRNENCERFRTALKKLTSQ